MEHRGGGTAPATLLRAAEAALHDHKRSGQRRWALFDPHRDADHRIQCRLAATMPSAWDSGEISLDYQPLVRLSDDTVVAVQALLHWNIHALPHHRCLELAAWGGLLLPLGQWMLRQACAQLASWRQRFGAATPLLHVDLTPQQSQDPTLVAAVISALDQAELAAEYLQLGIPVSLAERGVAIALLGLSGVAGLAYLEDLPAQTVELAPRVVQRVAQRPGDDSAVTQAVPLVLRLVHRCGATVIVRGLATRNDAGWWAAAGADVGQGAFLAPPAGPDEIVAMLGSRRISPRLRDVD